MIHTHTVGCDECGNIFPIPDKKGEGVTVYNASGGALSEGQVVLIGYDEATGQEVTVDTPATSAFPVRTALVMENGIADEEIGKVQISGVGKARVLDSSALVVGRALEVLNGATVLSDDGGAVRTTTTAAFLQEAVTEDEDSEETYVLKDVVLVPEQHTIAAS